MSANYYVVPTEYGRQLLREAHQGQPIQLKNLVIGDANNVPFTPESRSNSTDLINQRASVAIQSITAVNATTLQIKATLPSHIGGFFIHEVGLTDINDKLVYIGNYHGNYKPAITQGASSDMTFNIFIVLDKASVINISPSDSIIANQDWVHEQIRLMREHFEAQLKIERERVIEDVSVGELFFTTIDFKTAEEVAQHKGYGKWARFGNGEAIVSLRHKDTQLGHEWMGKIGATGGNLGTPALSLMDGWDSTTWNGTGTWQPRGRVVITSSHREQKEHLESLTDANVDKLKRIISAVQPSIAVGVWQRLPDTAVKYDGTIKLDGSHRYE